MDLVRRLLDLSREKSALGKRLRRILVSSSQWSLRPGALHRLLLSERSLRRQISDEARRALYFQPLFELLCEKAEHPFRMEVCPDSKVPVVSGCRLHIGRGVRLSARTTFSGARNAPEAPRIVLGEGTYIGHRVTMRAGLGITFGRRCFVASYVSLTGDPGHPLDPEKRKTEAAPLDALSNIVVGDDVWIGEGALILGNVTIGDGAVIGARAVVTRDIPPMTVATGSPARVVKRIEVPGTSWDEGLEAIP